jgi:hypothetical protein
MREISELFRCLGRVQTLVKEKNVFKKLKRKGQIRASIQDVKRAVEKCYQRFLVRRILPGHFYKVRYSAVRSQPQYLLSRASATSTSR